MWLIESYAPQEHTHERRRKQYLPVRHRHTPAIVLHPQQHYQSSPVATVKCSRRKRIQRRHTRERHEQRDEPATPCNEPMIFKTMHP
ncbi:MAG: hypothetical protein QG621_588 [Patescibacteria group bacterium]|nr:hypothetical protein [Patescibacteria group bacterium]